MNTTAIRRVYVWELPVRAYHWINAATVTVLAVTGYLIGSPPAIQNASEAYNSYWFGIVRFSHFVAAFLFFFNFIFRLYWGFVGNRYARWDNFILVRRAKWREVLAVSKVDIFQVLEKPLDSIGHNALAGLTYFFMFLAFLVSVDHGVRDVLRHEQELAAPAVCLDRSPDGRRLRSPPVAPRDDVFFIIFAIVHVYLVFYHDYVEGRGVTSSMVGGWKFVEKQPPRSG